MLDLYHAWVEGHVQLNTIELEEQLHLIRRCIIDLCHAKSEVAMHEEATLLSMSHKHFDEDDA